MLFRLFLETAAIRIEIKIFTFLLLQTRLVALKQKQLSLISSYSIPTSRHASISLAKGLKQWL